MYSPDSTCLREFNKIFLYDHMRIRQFQNECIEFIVDIGANIGLTTIFMKTLFPKAKIISIEPDPQNFECLQKNTFFIDGVYIENKSFGNKKSYNMVHRGSLSIDRYTVDDDNGNILGISMEEIFNKYNIDINSKYMIKSDCEGGESYMINDAFCEMVIRNSEIFFMEVHFSSTKTPMFQTKWEDYNMWVNKFDTTHKVEYFSSNKNRGYGHYLLYNKSFKHIVQ